MFSVVTINQIRIVEEDSVIDLVSELYCNSMHCFCPDLERNTATE